MKHALSKINIKQAFNILVYISLFCIGYYLLNNGYLFLPKIQSRVQLSASFIFLFSAFLAHALAWKGNLKRAGYQISTLESLASTGLSIFSKYVPGKVWVLLGRAAFISLRQNIPLQNVAFVSLETQIFALITGLLVGTTALNQLVAVSILTNIVITCILLCLVGVMLSHLLVPGIWLYVNKFLKIDVFPQNTLRHVFRVLFVFCAYWVLLASGFSFFLQSLSLDSHHFLLGFAFPFATCLGIIAVIFPGGLGIREGMLTWLLHAAGLPLHEAATVSVASRVWFLLGESFIFLLGLAASIRIRGTEPA